MFDQESDSHEENDRESRRLASVLVADICGFSSLAERNEAAALAVVRRVGAILNEIASAHDGRNFHEAGDGFFFEFASANRSIQAARQMLVEIARDQTLQDIAPVKIRIGMHLGDVQVEANGNLMGHGVNLAARLQQNADPGSILASSYLVQALSEKQGRFWSQRRLYLKNLKAPMVAYNIRDDRPLGMLVRDVWSSLRWSILAGIGVIVVALAFLLQTMFFAPEPGPGPIDREAVRASLAPLIEADRPIDDMVSALMRRDDFDAAIEDLRDEYDLKQAELSRDQSLDLLHQIAAISVHRDMAVAEQVYTEILKLDPFDPEALYQMAQMYDQRDFEGLARSSLLKALSSPTLTDRQRLRVEVGLVELDRESSSLESDVARLESLARESAKLDLPEVEHLARYTSIRRRFFGYAQADLPADEVASVFAPLIAETQALVTDQTEAGYLYQVSESLLTMSTMQNGIGDYPNAQQTLTRALEIEITLRRPSRLIGIHANLAYLNVAWHKAQDQKDDALLEAAERHVDTVRQLADNESLISRDYYNWYILALVEGERGNVALSCSHFEKAIQAWPDEYLVSIDPEQMANELNCTN